MDRKGFPKGAIRKDPTGVQQILRMPKIDSRAPIKGTFACEEVELYCNHTERKIHIAARKHDLQLWCTITVVRLLPNDPLTNYLRNIIFNIFNICI